MASHSTQLHLRRGHQHYPNMEEVLCQMQPKKPQPDLDLHGLHSRQQGAAMKFALDVYDLIALVSAALAVGIMIGMILEPNMPL